MKKEDKSVSKVTADIKPNIPDVSDFPEMPEVKKPLNYPEKVFGIPNNSNIGWICPRCGICWSPNVERCSCNPKDTKETIEKGYKCQK